MKSNKEVFEQFTDIHIPNAVEATNDEYQDMGQDYGKILEFQLDAKSKNDLETSILKSNYFNPSVYNDVNMIEEGQLIKFGDTKGVWYKGKNGYSFFGSTSNGRDNITVIMDTIEMSAKFHYLAE